MLTQTDKQMVDAGIRQGWEEFRVLQGNPVIDILRYETTNDSDYEVLEGDKTLVPGLSEIDAAIFPKVRKRKAVRGLVEYEEADMVFVIYDVEVMLTDQIQSRDKKYQVIKTNYNSSSGKCVATASKV